MELCLGPENNDVASKPIKVAKPENKSYPTRNHLFFSADYRKDTLGYRLMMSDGPTRNLYHHVGTMEQWESIKKKSTNF